MYKHKTQMFCIIFICSAFKVLRQNCIVCLGVETMDYSKKKQKRSNVHCSQGRSLSDTDHGELCVVVLRYSHFLPFNLCYIPTLKPQSPRCPSIVVVSLFTTCRTAIYTLPTTPVYFTACLLLYPQCSHRVSRHFLVHLRVKTLKKGYYSFCRAVVSIGSYGCWG